ncbi:MAG: hypothetical protein AVDCRST_MAG93-6489 [uncultured Chloroflexia bacterium]|uniref:Uncharacterized protein n=1 Tax=uncultured Chloroflexia bacterium TaxID=1672391 RepID=A0A6J4LTN4_9CHLR|nr:MAG: hypothetical protein AVDCRST_MAG93-6489 [uncultured Chloroflexia bacterium]
MLTMTSAPRGYPGPPETPEAIFIPLRADAHERFHNDNVPCNNYTPRLIEPGV